MKTYSELKQKLETMNDVITTYFLGLLWADGHIDVKRNTVSLSLTKNDMLNIENDILSIDKDIEIKYRTLTSKHRNSKPQGRIRICSKLITQWFVNCDYHKKSTCSASKIISKIPISLTHYWWRGYFDGDGYVGKRKMTITSNVNQDWSFLNSLVRVGVCFNIYKNTNKSSYSCACISNEKNMTAFLKYIYSNYENASVGLKRKYEKFLTYVEYKKFLREKRITKNKYIYCCNKRGHLYYEFRINNNKLKDSRYFTQLNEAIKYRDVVLP